MEVLGIDIGGTGIKGAIVDVRKGQLTTERFRVPTPATATPVAVAKKVKSIVEHFNWNGPIGCGFPTVVANGCSVSLANLDDSWLGVNIETLFKEHIGQKVIVINDADAAGLAEMKFGAGKDIDGTITIITIGTGIGSAVFRQGQLIPNTELGRLHYEGYPYIEKYCANSIRKSEELDWATWGSRLNDFLVYANQIIRTDLFILGGGVSKKMHKYVDQLTIPIKIVPAQNKNEAGIIGAALAMMN